MFFGLFGGEKKRVAEMIAAARTGNIEKVKQLLSKGVDINAPEPESGDTPLLAAIDKSQANVTGTVKDLTSQSVPLNFRQVTEQGAIYYIAQYPVPQQETRTFEIKVQNGDKINTINFNQELFPGE